MKLRAGASALVLLFAVACGPEEANDPTPGSQADTGGDTTPPTDGTEGTGGTESTTDSTGTDPVDADGPEPDSTGPGDEPDATEAPSDEGGDDGPEPDAAEPPPDTADPPDASLAPLCDPCWTSADCAAQPEHACVAFGTDGNFCGKACTGNCPDGYTCEGVPDTDGNIALYCVPVGGALCGCSEDAIEKGLDTACSKTSGGSQCAGTRTCTADGLSPCSADTPSPEACGGGDENCDGDVDEPGALGCATWYEDGDGDGHGAPDTGACLCAPDETHTAPAADDCNDDEPAAWAGAPELCDGLDNDCDSVVDPAGAQGCTTFLMDWDNDGFGVEDDKACLCGPTGKYDGEKGGDCDDNDSDVFPGAPCPAQQCNIFVLSGVCKTGSCGVPQAPKACPKGLVCKDGFECLTSCSANAHCQPGLFCKGGECVGSEPDGAGCTTDAMCLSGFCEGGVCCTGGDCCVADKDCDDQNPCTDEACVANVCETTFVEGSCKPAGCSGLTWSPGSSCVDGWCVADGPGEDCDGNEECTDFACSAAGCTVKPSPKSTQCGPSGCFEFEMSAASYCNGAGECKAGTQNPCAGGYVCNATQKKCLSSCGNDGECQPDAFCQGGGCVEKKQEGGTCSKNSHCLTGKCTGGFCCDGCCDFGTLGTKQLTRAMELCDELSYKFQGKSSCARVISDFGNFSHSDKAPAQGDSAMVQLSTGVASKINNQQTGENQSNSGSDPDKTVGTVHDLCGFTVTLKVPGGAKGFAFDFNFFSAEYPEWVGTQYNDSFNVMLTGQNYNNQNVAFDSKLKPISINVAFFTICNGGGCLEPGSKLAGTGYNNGVGGATGWLTTTVPVVPGETITLRFVIYDEGDHIYDSDVLINNFRWLEFVSGTGPVTEKGL